MNFTSRSHRLLSLLFLFLLLICMQPIQAQMHWNNAVHFAGGNIDQHLSIVSTPKLNLKNSFTIEAWVFPEGLASGTLVRKQAGGSSNGYSLAFSNKGKPMVLTNSTIVLVATDSLLPNKWTHVAVTFDSASNTVMYINGVENASVVTPSSRVPKANTDSVFIGSTSFAGMLDEVRIWERALSAAEIRRNFRTSLSASTGIYADLILSLTFQKAYEGVLSTEDWSYNGHSAYNRGAAFVDLSDRPSTSLVDNAALEVSGNGYVAMPSTSSNSPTNAATFEAWVYPRSVTVSSKGIIGKNYSKSFFLGLYGDKVRFIIAGKPFFESTTNVKPYQWNHVAVTVTADSTTIFINGVPDTVSKTTVGPIPGTTDSVYFGADRNGATASYFFDGCIDEVRITRYAKTAQQITDGIFTSIDFDNESPSGLDLVYNLDGSSNPQTMALPLLNFRGDAKFTGETGMDNMPVSPLVHSYSSGQKFPEKWNVKYSGIRIPETGNKGNAKLDSLYIADDVTISDFNLFLAYNHTATNDARFTVIAPSGGGDSTLRFWGRTLHNGLAMNIILDDDADSSFLTNKFVSYGSRVKPTSGFAAALIGKKSKGWWKLKVVDDAGGDTGRVYGWGLQINNGITSVKTPNAAPHLFELLQNYPNPFNPTTTISYQIPVTNHVTLKVYDVIGREVATLVNEVKSAGSYEVKFDASKLSSGIYFYTLKAGNLSATKKLSLIK